MKVLAIIPARGGSTGIPGKNRKELNGKPLIEYTIESGLRSKLISDIVVSTDDRSIADYCLNMNLIVPGLRPKPLATNDSPTIDTVSFTLELMMKKGKSYDVICLLQPTFPFRKAGLIDQAIEVYIKKELDSLISVIPVPHKYNPHWVFEVSDSGALRLASGDQEIIPRRQELPPAYIRDGAVYLTSTKVILRQGTFYGQNLGYIENQTIGNYNLDTISDWHEAEEYIAKNEYRA